MTELRIRTAHASDRDLLAQWAITMAMETDQRHLDRATVRAGIAAGIAEPAKARYFIAMDEAVVAGGETIAAPGARLSKHEWKRLAQGAGGGSRACT